MTEFGKNDESLYFVLSNFVLLLRSINYLAIRTTQKKRPFQFPKAYTNQIGNFDYVDKIGELIIKLIESDASGIYNVGTERKSMFDLALQTNPEVIPTIELFHSSTPTDLSMDLTKLNNFINK